jgi:hypothetical protein
MAMPGATQVYVFLLPPDSIEVHVAPGDTVASVLSHACEAIRGYGFDAHLGFVDPLPPDQIFTSLVDPAQPLTLEVVSSDDETDFSDSECEVVLSRSTPEIPSFTPPDMDDRIEKLYQFWPGHFTKEQCEHALRMGFFNADRAVAYLFDGIPEEVEGFITENEEPLSIDDGLTKADKESLERLFNQTRIDLPMLVQYYIACDRDEERTLEVLSHGN